MRPDGCGLIESVSLDPARKAVESVAEWLAACVRTDPSGARSLAHVMVVVPTAQSGRRLRQKLASRLGALVPPTVVQPQHLVLGEDMSSVAGRTDELMAFAEALGEQGTLEVASQFSDIRGILGGNALSFADVADRIGDILKDETADVEVARWREFAELEERYLAALAKTGKADRIVAMKAALENPPHFDGIERIVLACLLDPLPAFRQALDRLASRDHLTVTSLSLPPQPSQPSQPSQPPKPSPSLRLTNSQVWSNYEYFIKAVMPTAEKCGVRMGLHPDDPCLPELGGYARIFGTVADYDRAYSIYPSPSNAVTYCQANFKLMGADLIETARHFGKRIAFIHVRDVEGDRTDFTELFHDQGTTDQFALMRTYRELGLDVPVRGDHVPEMEGDRLLAKDCVPGYFTMGRLFANGYLKALMQGCTI